MATTSKINESNQREIWNLNNGSLEEVKRCVHEVIQDQVISRPNADAVCCDDGTTISYDSLDQLSSRLATYLRQLGVGRGAFVPLCFDKSTFNVVSMLGVMKAGAAFVPLDPAAPVARLQTLSDNICASVLLCSPQYATTLLHIVDNVIPVDGPMIDQLPQTSSNDRLPSVSSSDLAYLIFTSGTTGEPKGTMIEHGAYCSGAKAHGPAMLMHSGSRVLQFASHVFDASLVEILTTLMLGGVVCIPSEENRLNNLKTAMAEMKVNWAVLTPSFVGFIDPADVPELKTLVLAGEAMSKAHIETWSHLELVNGYGPSECSVASVVNSHVTPETSPSNIGRPTGVLVWVVDPENHHDLAPMGCVGELLIQGPSVARGYLNDIEKTKASFISAPAWASHQDPDQSEWRIYKTGDLVRQCPDGTLDFCGRKDTQVKVRQIRPQNCCFLRGCFGAHEIFRKTIY
jgi:amino acid adenylation domain-containing protein